MCVFECMCGLCVCVCVCVLCVCVCVSECECACGGFHMCVLVGGDIAVSLYESVHLVGACVCGGRVGVAAAIRL